MKFYLVILFSLATIASSAQPDYNRICIEFLQFYNAQSADSIFVLYSPQLKTKLPIEKTLAIISGLHIQYGELKSLELLKAHSGSRESKS